MHIFAYPSIWPETSCIALIEAMSAGLLCVHSAYAALPETSANWTMMYPISEDHQQHCNIFADNLVSAVNVVNEQFMQDRLNARLMNTRSTGSGRRENYRHVVLPRMRNTMMLSGKQTQDEMIKSVDKGIFAVSFGGGQVDITSGKFVFNCTEAYEIINGKIGSPIKGATLIGDGPSSLKEILMIGNDMMLDPGIGTCGKAGQGVPVGVGQPSLLINNMTVGGTQL